MPKKILFLCLLLVHTVSSASFAHPIKSSKKGPDKIVLPLVIHRNLPLVEAVVNGRKGKFIFDTGASKLILNEQYFTGYYPREDIIISSTNGESKKMRVSKVSELDLNGLRIHRFETPLIDLSHIEQIKGIEILGLLGREILRGYELMIDLPNQMLTMYRLDRKGNKISKDMEEEQPDYIVKATIRAHLLCMDVNIGQESLKFGIDTGAETNLMKKNLREKLTREWVPSKTTFANGVTNHRMKMHAGTIRQMQIGGLILENVEVHMINKKFFKRMLNTYVDGIMGVAFLQKIKISINYRKRKIGFWIPKPPKEFVDSEKMEIEKIIIGDDLLNRLF